MDSQIGYTNDLVFKFVFGTQKHQAARNGLINATLGLQGRERIVRSEVMNPFQIQETEEDKLSILDILAHTDSGNMVNLEMQVRHESDYISRVLYYACHLASSQLKQAEPYSDLPPIISISILDWLMQAHPQMHSVFRLLETQTHQELTRNLEFHFLQLRRLDSHKPHNQRTPLERWIFLFLRGEEGMSEIFDDLRKDEGMAEAMDALEQFRSDDRLRLAALARERAVRAYNSSVKYAREEGERVGREEGERVGREEGERLGREEGERLGREEGREEGAILGKLEVLLELVASFTLDPDTAANRMKAYYGQGHDELVSDYLGRLKDC